MNISHVMQPLQIKGVTIPNRVVRAAHGTNIGSGTLNEKLIDYHLARAKGGVGLTILETLGMHYTSPSGGMQLTPDMVERYRKLMDAVTPHGMVVFQQLWHAGNTRLPRDGSPPWAPSDVPNIRVKVVPIPMSKAMIDEIVHTFAETAAICEAGGLQGVELHGAHTYLIQQFLSPLSNFRTDDYGGSLQNRMRFVVEVLKAIRARVSPGFIVGIRLSTEEVPGGLTAEDNAEIVRRLQAESLIDFLDLSMGGKYQERPVIGTMAEPVGYEMATGRIVGAAATVPVIVAGRFRTLEEADQVIAHGEADMVAMVRAHIADPELVKKTVEGRFEDVRPCLGCNHGCVGAHQEGTLPHMGCTVNPVVGREGDLDENLIQVAVTRKRVLVVGGGPAGMEAARLAALRGHQVVLVEANSTLGGAIELARRAPKRHGISDITDWLEHQIYRLGVEVRLSTYVDADDVRELAPDAVIIATGSTPRMDGYQTIAPGEIPPGIELPHVISTTDLLTATNRDFGKTALVWDDVGHYEGIAAAEFLVEKGLQVTCVTGNLSFAHRMESSNTTLPALERLTRDNRFRALTRSKLVEIGRHTTKVSAAYNKHVEEVAADTVVLISYNRPNRELADALNDKSAGFPGEMKIVGDANSPRYLMMAIREGHFAGRAI